MAMLLVNGIQREWGYATDFWLMVQSDLVHIGQAIGTIAVWNGKGKVRVGWVPDRWVLPDRDPLGFAFSHHNRWIVNGEYSEAYYKAHHNPHVFAARIFVTGDEYTVSITIASHTMQRVFPFSELANPGRFAWVSDGGAELQIFNAFGREPTPGAPFTGLTERENSGLDLHTITAFTNTDRDPSAVFFAKWGVGGGVPACKQLSELPSGSVVQLAVRGSDWHGQYDVIVFHRVGGDTLFWHEDDFCEATGALLMPTRRLMLYSNRAPYITAPMPPFVVGDFPVEAALINPARVMPPEWRVCWNRAMILAHLTVEGERRWALILSINGVAVANIDCQVLAGDQPLHEGLVISVSAIMVSVGVSGLLATHCLSLDELRLTPACQLMRPVVPPPKAGRHLDATGAGRIPLDEIMKTSTKRRRIASDANVPQASSSLTAAAGLSERG
jgi:hypothetical protein